MLRRTCISCPFTLPACFAWLQMQVLGQADEIHELFEKYKQGKFHDLHQRCVCSSMHQHPHAPPRCCSMACMWLPHEDTTGACAQCSVCLLSPQGGGRGGGTMASQGACSQEAGHTGRMGHDPLQVHHQDALALAPSRHVGLHDPFSAWARCAAAGLNRVQVPQPRQGGWGRREQGHGHGRTCTKWMQ